MPVKSESKRIGNVNKELRKLTYNKYFEAVPFGKIDEILENNGFDHYRHGSFIGVYVSDKGRVVDDISTKSVIVVEWYKMPSGRFEVNTYAS